MADGTADHEKTKGVDLTEARERGRIGGEYWNKIYRHGMSDVAFLAGQHWTATEEQERGPSRITLTINDLGQYIDKVSGDIRMNPTAINVIPADFGASKAKFIADGGREYDGSEFFAGLIRQIEYKSGAKDHYNLALQHAAESGLGWLRVYTEYADKASWNQSLKIERIRNRFSVVSDPDASEPDASDQNWLFLGDWMRREDFYRQYPGASIGQIVGFETNAYWWRENYVRVSEYYWREEYELEIAQLLNGSVITDGSDAVNDEDKAEAQRIWAMAEKGGHIYRTRKHTCYRVKWAKVTYNDVLEGPITLPGTIIPVAPVYGKRIEGDEDTYHFGLVRFAKDPKRMQNYWLSSATEKVAMGTKAPYLLTPTMIKGHENSWANANQGLPPYLIYNPDPTAPSGAPQRATPTPMPAAEMTMLGQMGEFVKGSVGLHDAAVGRDTNKQSGRALLALEQQANIGNFVFVDNLRMAVSYVGRVLLEWIPSIFGTERMVTIRHDNGEVDTIKVNRVENGVLINDMKQGVYDQHVTTGPAYSTLRQQAAENMTDLFQAAPQLMAPMADIWLANMDWPGAAQMAKRARKMVPPHLLDDNELTEEERAARQQPPQPTPEQELMAKDLEAKSKTADANIAKADATMATANATIAKAEATTVEAQADVTISADRVEAQRQQTITRSVDAAMQQAPEPGQPQPSDAGESAPVTMANFEAFKNELAAALAPLVTAIQSIKGPTDAGQ